MNPRLPRFHLRSSRGILVVDFGKGRPTRPATTTERRLWQRLKQAERNCAVWRELAGQKWAQVEALEKLAKEQG